MKIAFFDFDGTITRKDSLLDFTRFAVGKLSFVWGLFRLSPILVGVILKIFPSQFGKEKFLSFFFAGWDIHQFRSLADEYALFELSKIVMPEALERIKWHQENGDEVVVVTASIDDWIRKWTDINHLKLIATKIEVKNSRITGKLLSKNCKGPEKVIRIKKEYDLAQYAWIYAYGNSSGDKELLELADERYYRYFN